MPDCKKITFIVSDMGCGGVQKVISLLANEWIKQNYNINIISFDENKSFFYLDSKINFIPLSLKRKYHYPGASIINRFYLFIKLARAIKRTKADILISVSPLTNLICLCIKKIISKPLIIWEQNNFTKKLPLHEKIGRRLFYTYAELLIVGTEFDYKKYFFVKNKKIIPNPIVIENSKLIFHKTREKIILAIGRFIKRKGFDKLIRIYSNIHNNYPDWSLEIAGDGDEYENIYNLISELKLHNNIKLLGKVQDLDTLYMRSSIFVLPSKFEGFPMVLLQAMSLGCPPVAFDCISGPRDIINHNVDGMLIENQDCNSMEFALCELMNNQDLRERLGKNAMTNITRYSIEKISNKWFSEIEKILKRND